MEISREDFKKTAKETANDTTRKIVKFLTFKGCYATRINTVGIYDRKFGGHRKSTTKLGAPDLIFCYEGKFGSVEVKHGNDKLSEYQLQTKKEIERSGGKYYVVHSFEEFMQLIGNYL